MARSANQMSTLLVEQPRWNRWAITAFILLIGYLTLSRSFAYLGLPVLGLPIPLYVGEAVLSLFLLFHVRESFSRLFMGLIAPSVISFASWMIYFFLLYGLFQTVRGVYLDSWPLLTAVQTSVFNIYPLFFFFGLWLGEKYPSFLRSFIQALAWVGGIYGIVWILFLTRFAAFLPGTPGVPVFGQPTSAYIAVFGLLCFERNLVKVWIPLLLNAVVLLGLQVRGGWVGFLAGVVVWVVVTKRFGRLGIAVVSVVGLIMVAYVFNLSLPATERGGRGEISAQNIVGAVVAPFDRDAALEYSPTARRYAGTAEWRTDWWRAIWRSVHEDPVKSAIGHGYGFPLTSLVSFLEGRTDLRTPHGVFFYALGYGGWLGVLLFAGLLVGLTGLLRRTYQVTGNPFGLVFVATSLGVASFGDFFEAPFGAIPFFMIVGLCAAPTVLSERRSPEMADESRLLETSLA
jgi:hypothetical protein